MITVRANGRPVQLPEGTTLSGLLEELGLVRQVAAVERNGEPVNASERGRVVLADGDRVELVRAVAGG
jgi:sulfur carrier protein